MKLTTVATALLLASAAAKKMRYMILMISANL